MAKDTAQTPAKREKKPGRIRKYFKDLKSECKKIVWTTRKDTFKQTAVVLLSLVVVAAVIGVMDFSFNKLVELLAKIA